MSCKKRLGRKIKKEKFLKYCVKKLLRLYSWEFCTIIDKFGNCYLDRSYKNLQRKILFIDHKVCFKFAATFKLKTLRFYNLFPLVPNPLLGCSQDFTCSYILDKRMLQTLVVIYFNDNFLLQTG